VLVRVVVGFLASAMQGKDKLGGRLIELLAESEYLVAEQQD